METGSPTIVSFSPTMETSPPSKSAGSASEPSASTNLTTRVFSDTIQIHVGSSDPFTVHRIFIVRLPFFEKCLRSALEEGVTNVIKLPEDDTQAFEDLLGFLYLGEPALNEYSDQIEKNNADLMHNNAAKALLVLYGLAEKYEYEELQNYIMDIFVGVGKQTVVSPLWMKHVAEALPLHCKMLKYHVTMAAYALRVKNNKTDTWARWDSLMLDWVEEGGEVVKEIVRLLMHSTPIESPIKSLCKWHEHKSTLACSASI